MSYTKPTSEGIEIAIDDGWSTEQAVRGYDIFDYNNTGLLEINRIDITYIGFDADVSDEDCAYEAERSGFCKIIPVDELPEKFDMKRFGWIDTPDNRKRIQEYTNNHN